MLGAATPPCPSPGGAEFPLPLDRYPAAHGEGLLQVLGDRIHADPFNLVASALFLLAIVHTFLTPVFRHWARGVEARQKAATRPAKATLLDDEGGAIAEVSFAGQILHFLGEVEAVFGVWAAVLAIAIALAKGWPAALGYIGHRVDFTEPLFVMVIMALASARPMVRLAERCLHALAVLGGGTIGAWWLSILIIGPLLGSLITEPAAMTISALLLSRHFYSRHPSSRLGYATIGLLFVNVSVGGTLTHFAAPPMVMVAGPWHWDSAYAFVHFGWKAAAGIIGATLLHYAFFRREFAALEEERLRAGRTPTLGGSPIPAWITAVQIAFMVVVVLVAHYPALFIGAFLFFLAFAQATAHHQRRIDLRPPLLVGFFLAGLVVHGGLQGWWLEPVLGSLGRIPLYAGAAILTAFNDNAAVTYLATLVPGFTDALRQAVVAGAVTGGGLTVIANAPNPAGQAILQRFFPDGVSPVKLLVAALVPTLFMAAAFMLL